MRNRNSSYFAVYRRWRCSTMTSLCHNGGRRTGRLLSRGRQAGRLRADSERGGESWWVEVCCSRTAGQAWGPCGLTCRSSINWLCLDRILASAQSHWPLSSSHTPLSSVIYHWVHHRAKTSGSNSQSSQRTLVSSAHSSGNVPSGGESHLWLVLVSHFLGSIGPSLCASFTVQLNGNDCVSAAVFSVACRCYANFPRFLWRWFATQLCGGGHDLVVSVLY